MTQDNRCRMNHTHIKIGYLKDCRISGLNKNAKSINLFGKILQALHIYRFGEYDSHWIYDKPIGDNVS